MQWSSISTSRYFRYSSLSLGEGRGEAIVGSGGNACINNAYTSFIGGGDFNCILSTVAVSCVYRAFIGGGINNAIYDSCTAIAGGELNTINAGAVHSFIGGGCQNTVSGSFSAILGGGGNSDGGFNNVFIAGSGVTGLNLVAGNGGLFVNELVIQNVAFAPNIAAYALLQAGQVYTDIAPNTGWKASQLFIV